MGTVQVSTTGLAKKWDDIVKKMPEFKDAADAASVEDLKDHRRMRRQSVYYR